MAEEPGDGAAQWHLGPLAAFDIETTGIDIEQDRVVTAAVVEVSADDTPVREQTWLLNPGVEIPEQAAAIHGISTEEAAAEGIPAAEGVEQITAALAEILSSGTPVSVMNAPFDLSLLDRECRRHGLAPLSERVDGPLGPILDPLVLDKHADRYRRGKRNLEALCAHYRVQHGGAHSAGADAIAAAAVTRRIGGAFAKLAALPAGELHNLQVRAAADQAASLQEYLRRRRPQAYVDPAWPLVPAKASA